MGRETCMCGLNLITLPMSPCSSSHQFQPTTHYISCKNDWFCHQQLGSRGLPLDWSYECISPLTKILIAYDYKHPTFLFASGSVWSESVIEGAHVEDFHFCASWRSDLLASDKSGNGGRAPTGVSRRREGLPSYYLKQSLRLLCAQCNRRTQTLQRGPFISMWNRIFFCWWGSLDRTLASKGTTLRSAEEMEVVQPRSICEAMVSARCGGRSHTGRQLCISPVWRKIENKLSVLLRK